jgi:hypothetical protein
MTTDGPSFVCAADLDGDGQPDLAVANWRTHSLSVLLNRGDGTFAQSVNYDVGLRPYWACAGDLDNDGDVDLATANYGDGTVSTLTNTGDGSFELAVGHKVGSMPRSVCTADLNDDGYMDLAAANDKSNDLSVLLNKGDGTFGEASAFPAAHSPKSIYPSDLDEDGDVDLVLAYCGPGLPAILNIMANDGQGNFSQLKILSAESYPWTVIAADLNEDGRVDLANTNYSTGSIAVFFGEGQGGYALDQLYRVRDPSRPQKRSQTRHLCASDLDADGDPDLAVACWGLNGCAVLRNQGAGRYELAGIFETGKMASSVASSDFNGDGLNDLVLTNVDGNTITVLTNTSTR